MTKVHATRRGLWVAAMMIVLIPPAAADSSTTIPPQSYASLQFRNVGPPGNRTSVITGVPGTSTVYAGMPSGGVFESADGGDHWKPIFDSQDVSAIGAIAIAPSDPRIVWVGTGDAQIRDNSSIGDGIYESRDGGATWRNMGLEETGRIARIVVNPKNPAIVYAAALGRGYGPQEQRGVYRSTDGGHTWRRVLFVDTRTGAADLAMSPRDPSVLFAAMWQFRMRPWGVDGGGPGSGIYRSQDGGTTWKKLAGGLPEGPLGRIGLAVSVSDPSRVYAVIDTAGEGSLWRSDDQGTSWKLLSRNKSITSRAAYYGRVAVFPDDSSEIVALDARPFVSLNGGKTLSPLKQLVTDNHDIWIDPDDPSRVFIVNDRYIFRSTNRMKSWTRTGMPNAQLYSLSVDNAIPYHLYGNRQDGEAFGGPSADYTASSGELDGSALTSGLISNDLWHWIDAGETGWSVPDPYHKHTVWTTAWALGSHALVARVTGRWSTHVDPPPKIGDVDARYFPTIPLVISSHLPERVYIGAQVVRETSDLGKTWRDISPDLTADALPHHQGKWVDFLTIASAISALADSRLRDGELWAGSSDGLIHVTRDDGGHWTDATPPSTLVPPLGLVTSIEPSQFNAAVVYVTIDRHRKDDWNLYVLKTADYGRTWHLIVSGIPKSGFDYARVIAEDPIRKGMLYLGTQNALYVSFDDGGEWQELTNNLPPAPVSGITVQRNFDDLVVATFGRGFWIMDDISPLQQMTSRILSEPCHLFPPRRTYELPIYSMPVTAEAFAEESDVPTAIGHDAPYGAPIDYYLRSPAKGKVVLQIYDSTGKLVRTLSSPSRQGINRVWWDLRSDAELHAQRNPWTSAAELVPAGRYTVTLRAAGTAQSASLEIVDDPERPVLRNGRR